MTARHQLFAACTMWISLAFVGACTGELPSTELTVAYATEAGSATCDVGSGSESLAPSASASLRSSTTADVGSDAGAGSDAGSGSSTADCICDECRRCNSIQKLCQVPNTGIDCNPGIPNGALPDWRWLVNRGSFANCAAISANGGTSSGYSYYGGTYNCVFQGCRPYP